MSNRIFFVVITLVGLAILLPLSQYFGGDVFRGGVLISRVPLSHAQKLDVTATIQPDAMARMMFQWFQKEPPSGSPMQPSGSPAEWPLSEEIFFAMAKPVGPAGATPTFVSYESQDGEIVGIAQNTKPQDILILLNRSNEQTWPSPADLEKLAQAYEANDGKVTPNVDITSHVMPWLEKLRKDHPNLHDKLVVPPKRELAPPKVSTQ